jgi:deoxyribodipyrimidine photo-lyase
MASSPHWCLVKILLVLFFMPFATVQSIMTSSSSSNAHAKAKKRIIVHWFRHGDLRLHDNPALVHSSRAQPGAVVVPFFCFDSKIFGVAASPLGNGWKCAPRRAQFVVESVMDLRSQLQTKLGSQLLVAQGEPAVVFDQLLKQLQQMYNCVQDISIVCQEEVSQEEKDTVTAVAAVLRQHCPNNNSSGGKLHEIWGSTMYDRNDLPFNTSSLHDMPQGFTPFRTKVEQTCKIAKPLPIPTSMSFPIELAEQLDNTTTFSTSRLPTLHDLGYTDESIVAAQVVDPRSVLEFRGGETAALARVQGYIWDQDRLRHYFDTRNGMIGADYSTKFSPWLAHGCLSPRQIVAECQRYEQQRVANKSTYWLVFELLWRDYCKFFALQHGNAIFHANGTSGDKRRAWSRSDTNLKAWQEGRTGYPLVDANMREMNTTGFMSNRGRQNVASFLAIDLAHDWRCGGNWFESQLIDYDVYSNWVVRVARV